MPKYHVVVLCSGPVGDAALTYRLTATSPQASEYETPRPISCLINCFCVI